MTKILYSVLALCVVCACSKLPDSGSSTPHGLDELKSNDQDYVSTNAREYSIRGTAQVVLDETEGQPGLSLSQDEKFAAAVARKLNRIDSAVKSTIDAIVRENNGGATGKDVSYFTYFRRGESSKSDAITVLDEKRAEFEYEIQLVGSYYLMSILSPGSASRRTMDIHLKGGQPGDDEILIAQIEGSPTQDAFPKYDELFQDGVLDMGIHFGGDYNKERFDLETAKWFVAALLEGGWTSEGVTKFDELTIDSKPFEKDVLVEGKIITVRVFVYHADMVPQGQESRLSDVMKESLAERDIVMYSGHAGSNAGFILDYDRRHEIRANEFASLNLAKKYQIYILDGCQTYRTYVQDLLKNPNKTFDNLDIVTTINTTPFSAGYQVLHEFMHWLTITNQGGHHYPLSWKTILRGVNIRAFKDVHYGVHGIANNPQLNPHLSEGVACTPCISDDQCGAGGNLCLGYQPNGGCGVACTTDTACPEGYGCRRLTKDPKLFYLPKQCVRRDYICPQ